jgi:membrane-associated phospholipid phosphatase
LKNQLSNTRTRRISIGLYVAIFLWSAQRFGVPVDRVAVTLWILGAFVFANVGKPLRAQRNMLRDWSVFAAMLFAYEYSRGLADQLGVPVQKTLVRNIDRVMFFGADPSVWLQERLNISSNLAWYEYPLAVTYMTHFILPMGTAVLLWWVSREQWVRYVRRLSILFFLAVATYVVLPVAPPWMIAKEGLIGPIKRITARGWSDMGLHTVSKLFERGSAIANPVAAMPSLHAACALLVVVFVWNKMRVWMKPIALVLPAAMAFCLVYFGEHYVADIIFGFAYVWLACVLSTRWEDKHVYKARK